MTDLLTFIDNVLTGGINIDTGGQAQDPSVNESRSNDQDHSLTGEKSGEMLVSVKLQEEAGE